MGKGSSNKTKIVKCATQKRLTKRALDAGDSAAFTSIFWLRVLPAPKQSPRPPSATIPIGQVRERKPLNRRDSNPI